MSLTTLLCPFPRTSVMPGNPARMLASLVLCDALALIVSVGLAVASKALYSSDVIISAYLRLWPFLIVFLGVYALYGLYSGVALSPQEELRRTTLASALVFVTLAAGTVEFRGGSSNFTWTLLLSILYAIAVVPIFRASLRYWLADADWWGYPAVIFGAGPGSTDVIRSMNRDPGVGLRPIAVIDDGAFRHPIDGVPVIRGFELDEYTRDLQANAYAVIVLSGQSDDSVHTLVDRYASRFSHVLFLPRLLGFSSYWVNEKMVGGNWGLEVCQKPSLPNHRVLKHFVDIVLVLASLPFLLTFVAVLALLVRLDSPGPVFYGHRRIGRHGRYFRAWKFRSMVVNGDDVLAQHLKDNAAAREEWELTHKLAADPRVTRIGNLLRKSSLDELPQLWNVLRGDMSLVGPRPIVDAEVAKYGTSFDLYKSVDSGLTGLWQVSGRNDTSYEERVTLDTFYARNWSVWLDICILFRTVGAVLFRKGAY